MKKTIIKIIICIFLISSMSVCSFAAPNDRDFSKQWTYEAIHYDYDQLQAAGLDGSGVCVAIIDSGLYRNTKDMQGIKISKKSKNFLGDGKHASAWDRDQTGHGTFVASRIACSTNNAFGFASIAPKAELMILRCFSGKDSAKYDYNEVYDSGSGELEVIADAIKYAADNGADVVNLSCSFHWYSKELSEAVKYAISKNVLLIAASGNGGDEANSYNYVYPASYPKVIAVGSIRRNEDDTYVHEISSMASDKVDITAPGEDVYGIKLYPTINTPDFDDAELYDQTNSGTSFSTPIVAAAAALARQKYADMTHDEFLKLLAISSDDYGDVGKDDLYGYGVLNMEKLVHNLAEDVDIAAGFKELYGELEKEDDIDTYIVDNTDAGEMNFIDAEEGDWFFEDVKYCFDRSLLNGISENEFGTNSKLTRAMMVSVLHRMAGSPKPEGAMTFTDVPSYAYYRQAVKWAQAAGVVTGYGSDTFAPNDVVSRQDLIAVLSRFSDYMGYTINFEGDLNQYVDHDMISPYAQHGFLWMSAAGIIKGMDDGQGCVMLLPRDSVTRAQFAAILHRYAEGLKLRL